MSSVVPPHQPVGASTAQDAARKSGIKQNPVGAGGVLPPGAYAASGAPVAGSAANPAASSNPVAALPSLTSASSSASAQNLFQTGTRLSAASTANDGTKKLFAACYDLKEKLGKGQFAIVYKAVHKKTGTKCAVKVMIKSQLTKEDLDALSIEVKAMQMLTGHPNFVGFYDFFDEAEHFYLCMEIIKGGELFDRICEKAKYTEREARDLLRQLAAAIAFCHAKGVAHRDLKPENILLKSRHDDTSIKLGDLGFAKLFTAANPYMTTPCGTPGYVSSEVLSGNPYTCQTDIWSLGVIFYILLCGYPPFATESDDQKELFALIKAGKYDFDPREWGAISDQAKDLIRHMLVTDPTQRYTAEQVLRHPWMQMDAAALPDVELGATLEQLKRFNARRRLKKAMHAVRAAVRTKFLLAARVMKQAEAAENSGQSAEEVARAANSPLALAMLAAKKEKEKYEREREMSSRAAGTGVMENQ